MIRSLNTAVSGLKGHQIKLDVIGNNIANVNTAAFKRSQTRFEDLLSQTMQGATGPMVRGGMNPSQVGMGMRIASIVSNHQQGPIQNTDRQTDLAIEGAGYFVVSDGREYFYTRDGAFGQDASGHLVNADGLRLMGWTGLTGGTAAELVPLQLPLGEKAAAGATSKITFAGNLDARGGAEEAYDYQYFVYDSLGGRHFVQFSFAPETGWQVGDRFYAGAAEDPACPLRNLFADAEEGAVATVLRAGGAIIAVKVGADWYDPADVQLNLDKDGLEPVPAGPPALTAEADRTEPNCWRYQATMEGQAAASGVLRFSPDGQLDKSSLSAGTLNFQPQGAGRLSVQLDFAGVTQLAQASSVLVREQNGFSAGELVSFEIGRSGIITGTYSNGMIKDIARVPLAFFVNPEGLVTQGGNAYRATANSGEVRLGLPGTEGRGTIRSSSLEMSNADIAVEFTELITTSRAFQANTRVVTTSDEILLEVINMKR